MDGLQLGRGRGRDRGRPRLRGMEYMNSGGIGLLVTLLVRAQRGRHSAAGDRPVRPLPPDPLADPPRRGDRDPRRRGGGLAGRGEARHDAANATPRNWAQPVERLSAAGVAGASVDSVSGRRVSGPLQGFGQLWQKTFPVRLDGTDLTPARPRRHVEGALPDVLARAGPVLRAPRRHRPGRGRPARHPAGAGLPGQARRPGSWSCTPTTSRSRS